MRARLLILIALSLPAVLIGLEGCRDQRDPRAPESPEGVGEPVETIAVPAFAMGTPDVVLLVTGGSNGRLEICSCCGIAPGGLTRRSGLAASYRAAFPRTLLLDTGDAFWVDPKDFRNDFVVQGYRLVGYDVQMLADHEWAVAPDRLRHLFTEGPVQYLSTNVVPTPPPLGAKGPRGPAVVPCVLREWGAVKVAVVSDAPPDSLYIRPERRDDVQFTDPNLPARIVDRLKDEGYVVILIAHAGAEAVERIAAATRADLILRGHLTRSDGNVNTVAGKPVLKIGGADHVGAVALKVSGGRMVALEYRLEAVDDRWPIDERLKFLYESYAHAEARQALDANRDTPVEYVSSAECGKCHARQYEFWKGTSHSGAYGTLVKESKQTDSTCLVCHVSGLGLAGGFASNQKTPHLAGVNCQDCHRLNVAEHRRPGFRVPRVPQEACQVCHTPLQSPHFMDFYEDDYKTKATCPK